MKFVIFVAFLIIFELLYVEAHEKLLEMDHTSTEHEIETILEMYNMNRRNSSLNNMMGHIYLNKNMTIEAIQYYRLRKLINK